ncbi:lysine-specific demethylase JMJ31 [Typha latifolia]|uniref:lysine-specific demethylase JMJ31 n=1 Tax=Typha latifolia TaxID=4733 RepID=UPI003C2EEDAF
MEAEVGDRVEPALRVRQFEEPPSPGAFSFEIEPSNVPAVFRGVVKDWEASSKWNPFDGGLDYLEEKVGSAVVEAMTSKSAPVFYGDLRSHERVPLPFSTFNTSCKSHLQHLGGVGGSSAVQEVVKETAYSEGTCSTSLKAPDQFYLAQVSIFNAENEERCSLEILRKDIQTPIFLGTRVFSAINFWMNRARSRSSTHYDPHHNLLCVVAGCKQVVLWPPSACPFLYPMPVYGEASNHSAVDIQNPDLSLHPRAKHSKEYSEKIILHSGDALFIPEGWFHQVDSDDLTIAVNFWWKSRTMTDMLEHMDAYYLRRVLNRLVDKEMNKMLCKSSVGTLKDAENSHPSNEDSKGSEEHDFINQMEDLNSESEKHGLLQQLEPFALQALYELISLVHDSVKVDQDKLLQSSNPKGSSANVNSEKKIDTDNSSLLENDSIANIFWALEPLVLRKVLLAMVHHFPRTLEALIIHMLGPTGAEVLTQKFDEMDHQTTKEQQAEFYKLFYSIFDDQYAAMDAILNGKEMFAFQAFRNVLDLYLGVHVDQPES